MKKAYLLVVLLLATSGISAQTMIDVIALDKEVMRQTEL